MPKFILQTTIQDNEAPVCSYDIDPGEPATLDSPGMPRLIEYEISCQETQLLIHPNPKEHNEILQAIERHDERRRDAALNSSFD